MSAPEFDMGKELFGVREFESARWVPEEEYWSAVNCLAVCNREIDRLRADLAPSPETLAKVDAGAVEALANYQQADMDGTMVLVSRQAIEECLPALRAALAALEPGDG